MRKTILTTAIVALSLSASANAAQSGLVNVSIDDVSILNNFLNDTQLAALNNLSVPVTVQVPVGVAANVCDVSAAVLAGQKKTGSPTCTAKSGSQALAKGVNDQLLSQKK